MAKPRKFKKGDLVTWRWYPGSDTLLLGEVEGIEKRSEMLVGSFIQHVSGTYLGAMLRKGEPIYYLHEAELYRPYKQILKDLL